MSDEQYFTSKPNSVSDERTSTLVVAGRNLQLVTDRGVFAKKGVDQGTQILLDAAPRPPSEGTFLDLGCGSGAIALALASYSRHASIMAVDVNARALQLVSENARRNDLRNITALFPQSVPVDLQFDLIWSNPPIRIGKQALHDLLNTWLNRLSPTGQAWLVVNRNLGSDSLAVWMMSKGFEVARHTSKRGFRVLKVTRERD
jgi:16S rRNA G1207 methylase RsmC